MPEQGTLMRRLVLTQGELKNLVCKRGNYFLSWRLFVAHADVCNLCHFVSLGTNLSSWIESTLDVESVYDDLLLYSSKLLERTRGKPISLQATEILVGHTLQRLSALIQRTQAQLRRIEGSYKLESDLHEFSLEIPMSSQDSSELVSSPDFQELCHLLMASSVSGASEVVSVHRTPKKFTQAKHSWWEAIYLTAAKLLAPISRKSKYLIVATYMGRFRELLLGMRLGQVPLLAEVRAATRDSSQHPSRSEVLDLIDPSIKTVLGFLVDLALPTSLMVEPDRRLEELEHQGWPRNPKVIFTSNAFDADDDFKLYLERHRSNVKYIVGQHGNNYSVATWTSKLPEVSTSDIFLSWGVSDYRNALTVGVLKPSVAAQEISARHGVLVVLRDALADFQYADPDFNAHLYESAILDYTRGLLDLGVRVRIRPHSSSQPGFLEELRGLFGKNILFELPTTRGRLDEDLRDFFPVFTYDSTGMLEFASLGAGFHGYLPDGLSVNERCSPIYQGLKNVGVISTSLDQSLNSIRATSERGFELNSSQVAAINHFGSSLARQNPRVMDYVAEIILGKKGHQVDNFRR